MYRCFACRVSCYCYLVLEPVLTHQAPFGFVALDLQNQNQVQLIHFRVLHQHVVDVLVDFYS